MNLLPVNVKYFLFLLYVVICYYNFISLFVGHDFIVLNIFFFYEVIMCISYIDVETQFKEVLKVEEVQLLIVTDVANLVA